MRAPVLRLGSCGTAGGKVAAAGGHCLEAGAVSGTGCGGCGSASDPALRAAGSKLYAHGHARPPSATPTPGRAARSPNMPGGCSPPFLIIFHKIANQNKDFGAARHSEATPRVHHRQPVQIGIHTVGDRCPKRVRWAGGFTCARLAASSAVGREAQPVPALHIDQEPALAVHLMSIKYRLRHLLFVGSPKAPAPVLRKPPPLFRAPCEHL